MGLENILQSLRKSVIVGLTGASILGSSMFYSPQVKAGDITETKTISLVTSSDTDGDGLTNSYESSIGTNPNVFDTDGDLMGDGEEIGYKNNSNDPLNFDSPGFGSANTVHKMRSIQNLTSGVDNVIASTWLVGGKIAYIEGGSLFVKNLFDLSEPRTKLVSGLGNQSRELCAGPMGDSVYFHVTDGTKEVIKKVDVNTGDIFNVIPNGVNNIKYGVRNPSISGKLGINALEAKLTIEGDQWLVAETNLPNVTHGQVYKFKLISDEVNPNFGIWDGSAPIKITNSQNKIVRPKVSGDGDKLMFQEMINDGSSTLLLFNGLNGISSNLKKPYDPRLLSSDLRGGILESYLKGVAFPGGFGRGFAYWTIDKNNTYSLDRNNFNDADFEITSATYGTTPSGRFGVIGNNKSTVIPRNQLGISISPEGGRVAFLDNYLEESEGNYNLYGAATKGSFKIVEGLEAEYLNGYKDSSGISLEGNYPYQTIHGGNSLFSISMLFNPISDASGSEYFSGLREFEPSGLEIRGATAISKANTPRGIYMKLPWDNTELVTPDGILDENTIIPAWQIDGSTSEYSELPESQILERNLDENYIKFYTEHFSGGGFKAKLLEKVSAVNDWMYMEQNVNDYKIDTSTEEYKPYVLELKPWEP